MMQFSINHPYVFTATASALAVTSANFLSRLVPLFLAASPKISASTTNMGSASTNQKLIYCCGTFENCLPWFARSTQSIKQHLPHSNIEIIEITQSHALEALTDENKAKTPLGLSAAGYVEGSYAIIQDILKQHPDCQLIISGFSQGGGVAVQVAARLLEENKIAPHNIAVLSINGAIHSTFFSKVTPHFLINLYSRFYTCTADFKHDSDFFNANKNAIQQLRGRGIEQQYVCAELDGLISPADANTTLQVSSTQILAALAGLGATIYVGQNDWRLLTVGLVTTGLTLGFSNHALSPMSTYVGQALRKIVQNIKEPGL